MGHPLRHLMDVVELGYVPFETSGEALRTSRWDLESQASTRELESHVVSESGISCMRATAFIKRE